MLIAIIVLSILLVLSLTVIAMIGIDDQWDSGTWFGMLCFIFCLPLWAILKVVTSSMSKKK